MRFSICARLVIPPNRENCEINAEADENRAKGNTDHAESPEKKLPGCKRHQTGEDDRGVAYVGQWGSFVRSRLVETCSVYGTITSSR